MKFFISTGSIFLLFLLILTNITKARETQRIYLSGKGIDDAKEWDFYCTEGRKSGEWTKIPVPSCWEQHGFGTYNYGHDADEIRGKEKGLYRLDFFADADWKNKTIRIVFEGSMTDTEVKINGKSAGDLHQGAFYRFSYDITKLIKFNGINLLEVSVSKHSADPSVNDAERYADYWIFGGIFRPVYLEITPREYIERLALDARADGTFRADVYVKNIKKANRISARVLDPNQNQIDKIFETETSKNTEFVTISTKIDNIDTWSPEFPNLYHVEINLMNDDQLLHSVKERFGFRTVEVKQRDGIYVNGVKIKFKGVCRHSFWPESGRALSKDLSIKDVQLMKDMNMNAVRMSHYPPDPHFLDVCDSIGLFVLDELAGWQAAYDTEVGKKLVKEMVTRDVNHPSIIIWDNGNEGGWNTDLDDEFVKYDPQQRILIHPYEKFRETDTNHYIDYNYGTNDSFNGSHIFFPTEVLHGLYDGGHGAGLDDFWDLMWRRPTAAGGFLWVFSDEAIKRTDKNGMLDSDGNHAPDGILGPYREKEGSYFTIKEVWAPVYFEEKYITETFNGSFKIENRYHFTNLNQCDFSYELVRFQRPHDGNSVYQVLHSGDIVSPNVTPGDRGILKLDLPANWNEADALFITAVDPHGRKVYTWDWPIHVPEDLMEAIPKKDGHSIAQGIVEDELLIMSSGNLKIEIEKNTGLLHQVTKAGTKISISGGPKLAEGNSEFVKFETRQVGDAFVYQADYQGNLKSIRWMLSGDGILNLHVVYVPNNHQPFFGINFNYPEQLVNGIKWLGDGPYRVWKNRMKGISLNVWEKDYNKAVTGEICIYPEFKGYHSNMYWLRLLNDENDFTVYTTTENLFFRMYTPDDPAAEPRFTKVKFPDGDISFLQGINAIGTKFKPPENLGPQSQLNMYRRHRTDSDLHIDLYFIFSATMD
jgi:hypothetical protein